MSDHNDATPEEKRQQRRRDKPISALDRLVAEAVGQARKLGADDDPAKEKFPCLWEWLSRVQVGRDYLKQPATLTIRLGPEGALASLSDRDLQVSIGAACPHLEGLLDALESALSSTNPPISSWGKKEPHLRKRKAGN